MLKNEIKSKFQDNCVTEKSHLYLGVCKLKSSTNEIIAQDTIASNQIGTLCHFISTHTLNDSTSFKMQADLLYFNNKKISHFFNELYFSSRSKESIVMNAENFYCEKTPNTNFTDFSFVITPFFDKESYDNAKEKERSQLKEALDESIELICEHFQISKEKLSFFMSFSDSRIVNLESLLQTIDIIEEFNCKTK